MLLLVGMQVFNGILARYPDSSREIATFAYATSMLFVVEVSTVFLTQMVAVYGKNDLIRKKLFNFCLLIGIVFTLPILFLSISSTGKSLLSILFNINNKILDDVTQYLFYLSPSILLRSLFCYFSGLLIQNNLPKIVSLSAFLSMSVSIMLSLTAFNANWSAMNALVFALISSQIVLVIVTGLSYKYKYKTNFDDLSIKHSYVDLYKYFWPVCISGLSFGISRPLLYVFISRTPNALFYIASLRISFDFFMLVQVAVNQFRNIIPTMGLDDLKIKRQFIMVVTILLILILLIIISPPMNEIIFKHVLGLNKLLYESVITTIFILLITPLILANRNFYHGILLFSKQTKSMALASSLRVLTIGFSAWSLLVLEQLNQFTAAVIMLLAFTVEMTVIKHAGQKVIQPDL